MQSGYTKEKYSVIREEGATLQVGEHKYIICPFCQAQHEKKLCITRTEVGYLFHCFRASCGKNGVVGEYYKSPLKEDKGNKEYRRYEGFLLNIPEPLWKSQVSKYDISLQQLKLQGIKYAVDEDRMYYPVFNFLGYQIGETLKAIGNAEPKNLTNRWCDTPLIHFPTGQRVSNKIVLVEDHLSAIKVGENYQCAALMGTYLTEAGFNLLKRHQLHTIIVMLDGNALLAAYRMANKYGAFAEFKIINTPEGKDPKDLSYEQIKTLIEG